MCGCKLCSYWMPLIENIKNNLTNPEAIKQLDELVSDWMYQSMDRAVAESKLEGKWPGWEDLKGYNPDTHTVVVTKILKDSNEQQTI